MSYEIDETIFNLCVNKMLEIIPKQKEHNGLNIVTFDRGFFPSTEGFKSNRALLEAQNALDRGSWTTKMIGSGKIIADVMDAMSRNHKLKDYHSDDFEEKSNKEKEKAETLLYMFYHGEDEEKAFNDMVEFYGRKYDMLAFLMFLKNKRGNKDDIKYLPCRNGFFADRFKKMGIKTHCVDDSSCSWENYNEFLTIINDVKNRLAAKMKCKVTLIDAHSFVWATYLLDDKTIPQMFEDYVEGQLNITKEEWITCINDIRVTSDEMKDLLIKIYHYPNKAASCKELGIDEDVDSSTFISPVVAFARRILEKLGLNVPKRKNGENAFWVVPFLGRYKMLDGMRLFDWKLRPELADAMQDVWINETLEKRTERDEREAPKKSAQELFEAVTKNPYKTTNKLKTVVEQYPRDPRVREFAKKCAKGVCQLHGDSLDFNDSTGMPYLETHHIVPLADGGKDVFENVIALCPNCHKKMHVLHDPEDVDLLLRIAAGFVKSQGSN